jgi:membrane protease subunit (stomatin/prohibitin family)
VFWKHSRFVATKSEKPSKWGTPPALELKNEMDPKTKAVKRVRIEGIMEHEFKDPDEMVAFLDAV